MAKTKTKKSAKKSARGNGTKRTLPVNKGTIGATIVAALKAGTHAEDDDILRVVKKKFPKASTTVNSVRFYRAQLRAHGELPRA